jgi:hypothetical protein
MQLPSWTENNFYTKPSDYLIFRRLVGPTKQLIYIYIYIYIYIISVITNQKKKKKKQKKNKIIIKLALLTKLVGMFWIYY